MQKKIDLITDLISKSKLSESQVELFFNVFNDIVFVINKQQNIIDKLRKKTFDDVEKMIICNELMTGTTMAHEFYQKMDPEKHLFFIQNYDKITKPITPDSIKKILDLLDLYEYTNDRKAETIEEIRDFYIQIENDANTQD